jgi:hypothetical protein
MWVVTTASQTAAPWSTLPERTASDLSLGAQGSGVRLDLGRQEGPPQPRSACQVRLGASGFGLAGRGRPACRMAQFTSGCRAGKGFSRSLPGRMRGRDPTRCGFNYFTEGHLRLGPSTYRDWYGRWNPKSSRCSPRAAWAAALSTKPTARSSPMRTSSQGLTTSPWRSQTGNRSRRMSVPQMTWPTSLWSKPTAAG